MMASGPRIPTEGSSLQNSGVSESRGSEHGGAEVDDAGPGASLDADTLSSFCRETLSGYKVPAHWDFRDEPLPRNAAGKVLKNVLSGAVVEKTWPLKEEK